MRSSKRQLDKNLQRITRQIKSMKDARVKKFLLRYYQNAYQDGVLDVSRDILQAVDKVLADTPGVGDVIRERLSDSLISELSFLGSKYNIVLEKDDNTEGK